MSQKTVLVTGASDGIGFQTARELMVDHGFRCLVHGRSERRAREAVERLEKVGAAGGFPVWGELGARESVAALASQVLAATDVLDVLINNAGVFMTERTLTVDGFETTVQVNHLAHLQLTHLLMPRLRAASAARVVNVSSGVHFGARLNLRDLTFERGYDGYTAYSVSKLMNVLFTHALARRLKGTAIVTSALHPGVINTKLLRTGFGKGGASLQSGARTTVYCAIEPSLATVSGRYYSDARETPCAAHANNLALEEELYALSCELMQVEPLPVAAR